METAVLAILGYSFLGYSLGSIPFGVLLTRLAGLGNLQQIGSGNIGATNVLRTGRTGLAAATLLLDVAKGAAAVLIAGYLATDSTRADHALIYASAGVLIGHCYPIWLCGRGGKGVATFLGISLALAWPVGAVFIGVWLLVAMLFRSSSLAGIIASLSVPIAAWRLGDVGLGDRDIGGSSMEVFVPMLAALAVLITYRHHDNIRRLLVGKEPCIGKSESPSREGSGDGSGRKSDRESKSV